jgi:hypothetical protein
MPEGGNRGGWVEIYRDRDKELVVDLAVGLYR